jgi:phosphopantothenoylcysteine decarboxylase/phosphopantothenate--cysteine ligase
MGGAENQVVLVTRQGIERWPRLDKGEVASRLARRIAEAFAAPDAGVVDAAE